MRNRLLFFITLYSSVFLKDCGVPYSCNKLRGEVFELIASELPTNLYIFDTRTTRSLDCNGLFGEKIYELGAVIDEAGTTAAPYVSPGTATLGI